MTVMTITSKGQMTLPKAVRDDLKVGPGDKIDVIKQNGQYVLRPRKASILSMAGILGRPPSGRGQSVEEMADKLGEALAEDDERIRAGR